MVAENADDVASVIAELEEEMQAASAKLEFERAALLRDQINELPTGDYRKIGMAPSKEYPTRARGRVAEKAKVIGKRR